MKFFTPELYLRYNSPYDTEADQAAEAWEEALRAYGAHLARLRDDMPPRIRDLAERRCFHDAEFVGVQVGDTAPVSVAPGQVGLLPLFMKVAVVALRQADALTLLVYLLWQEEVRESRHEGQWPFSPERREWLYDEFDVASGRPNAYWHRVLLSDGTQYEFPLSDVFIQTVPAQEPETAAPVRAGA